MTKHNDFRLYIWFNSWVALLGNMLTHWAPEISTDHDTFLFLTTGWPQNQIKNWKGWNMNIWLGLLRGVLQATLLMLLNNVKLKLAYNCRKNYFLGNGTVTFNKKKPTTGNWKKIKTVKLILINFNQHWLDICADVDLFTKFSKIYKHVWF